MRNIDLTKADLETTIRVLEKICEERYVIAQEITDDINRQVMFSGSVASNVYTTLKLVDIILSYVNR